MVKLGVNIDHVATVRQARKGRYPDVQTAARICEKAGCDSIVCHLREDRRHINDSDVYALKRTVKKRLNLEMSLSDEIVNIACRAIPDQVTIVPEKRQELTTEGGLNVIKNMKKLKKAVEKFKKKEIDVSLFIDPNSQAVDAALESGADMVEIHTGKYTDARTVKSRKNEFIKIKKSIAHGAALGLVVHAGHGLDYKNVSKISGIEDLCELNIGHSIVSRSIFIGLGNAVKEMMKLISRK